MSIPNIEKSWAQIKHVIVTPTMSISTWMAGPACAASTPFRYSKMGNAAPTTVDVATMQKTDAPGCGREQLQDASPGAEQRGPGC